MCPDWGSEGRPSTCADSSEEPRAPLQHVKRGTERHPFRLVLWVRVAEGLDFGLVPEDPALLVSTILHKSRRSHYSVRWGGGQ